MKSEEITMNTYLVPVSSPYYYDFDYFIPIYAHTQEEAYQRTLSLKDNNYHFEGRLVKKPTYTYYPSKLKVKLRVYHNFGINDIINIAFKNKDSTQNSSSEKGFAQMGYFNVNWNKYTTQLAAIANKENWSNSTYPNNGILANYIVKTYEKLSSEKKIAIGKDYALFNTGLFNEYYDTLYAYQTASDISFLTGYELGRLGVKERPARANYFKEPELLLFDWHYPIDVHYTHILNDEKNKKRLPKEFLNSNNKISIMNGSLDIMKKRVSANYKLAVPQYYEGKIQLLLPLCLMSDDKPDVAIAVTKKDNSYQGHTCITLDMAYNNARLIAKPESNWLSQN